MTTYGDLADAQADDVLHVQVRLDGPDAWSHHEITAVEIREQPDGSRRLVLVSDPEVPSDPGVPPPAPPAE